jgi:peptidoglycan biosynthesis protein MviN/MurJ (putative lipid II flippase)
MWIIAGINVFHIGVQVWQIQKAQPWIHFFGVLAASLFFAFIFHRSYTKNVVRISKMNNPRNPLSFFDLKGWLIIVFMITLGVSVRHFELLPRSFIAPFYQGLGMSLCIYGGRFLWKGAMYGEG